MKAMLFFLSSNLGLERTSKNSVFMTTVSNRTICLTCNKHKITYICQGCSECFCFDHLLQHRTDLHEQLHLIESAYKNFRQNIEEKRNDSTKYSLIKQVDQWEKDSIEKIQQIAQEFREKLIDHSNQFLFGIEEHVHQLIEQTKRLRQKNEFNEINLNNFKQKLNESRTELAQLPMIFTKNEPTSTIESISLNVPIQKGNDRTLFIFVMSTFY